MKIINSFFKGIIFIQKHISKFENWYEGKQKYLPKVYAVLIAIAVGFMVFKYTALGITVIILVVMLSIFQSIVGWRNSVLKWLIAGILYNLIYSVVLAVIMNEYCFHANVAVLFTIIYLFMWIFLSLISNSEVAVLINETISGGTAAIFTIGTYITSILSKSLPSVNERALYFQDDSIFEQALERGDDMAIKFFKAMLLERLDSVFMIMLPIIGITTASIIMIKIKIYWMKKMEVEEP
ncbi:hypothetical protein [Lachnospira intestinalis]|uniref:DUF4199 domain-containing protein n=1 Tax=Lachnospira intestinalis TaxID=3133158 RepID=A0ABV1H4M1_9FIRM